MEQRIAQILETVLSAAKNGACASGFFIGNTAKLKADEAFFTPLRRSEHCVAGSIVVGSVSAGVRAASFLDGRVDYLFVDAEKKIEPRNYGRDDAGNLEKAVRAACRLSRIVTFKANDLATESLDMIIAALRNSGGLGSAWPQKTAIVGAGNIGSKLGLKLVERGHHVWLYRRNRNRLELSVKAINGIKPERTLASAHIASTPRECIEGADLVVGLSNGEPSINFDMVKHASTSAVFIDGGKGTFSHQAVGLIRERNGKFLRADIQPAVGGLIDSLLSSERAVEQSMLRREVDGITLVGAGIFAYQGEIVVDSGDKPKHVFGISDGFGELVTQPDEVQLRLLNRVRLMISRGQL